MNLLVTQMRQEVFQDEWMEEHFG
jgi:hypothetical protein